MDAALIAGDPKLISRMIYLMKVYLNGELVDASQATISHNDAGLQHAVGLFETMAAKNGVVFRLDAHLRRLERSAAELGLARDLDVEELRKAVRRTLEVNGLTEARLRLTVTGGPMGTLRSTGGGDGSAGRLTVLVVAAEPTAYDPSYFEKGIMAVLGPPMANPFDPLAGHKTLAYWSRLRLLRQAAALRAGEVILLNITNHLASGTVSNVFLVKEGRLLTPYARGEEVVGALPAPVLPGITRAAVVELAQEAGIDVEKRMLTVDDLLSADEVFLTNSSWQILPVTRVEKHAVTGQEGGPVASGLRAVLLGLIEREAKISKL